MDYQALAALLQRYSPVRRAGDVRAFPMNPGSKVHYPTAVENRGGINVYVPILPDNRTDAQKYIDALRQQQTKK